MTKKSHMFSDWSEVTSGERNEIVFERLNKTYGAYEIRTNYDNTLMKAFSATLFLIVLFSSLTLIPKSKEIVKDIPTPPDTIIFTPPPYHPFDPPKAPKTPQTPKTNSSNFTPVVVDSVERKTDTTQFASTNNNQNGNGENKNPDSGNISSGSGDKEKDKGSSGVDSVYEWLDGEMPSFPGGEKEMFAFLKNNISFPPEIKEIGGRGTVGISFIVDKDGAITEATVLKKTKFFQLDEEALRVVKKFPKWIPGKQQGRSVRVRMILPIRFEVK